MARTGEHHKQINATIVAGPGHKRGSHKSGSLARQRRKRHVRFSWVQGAEKFSLLWKTYMWAMAVHFPLDFRLSNVTICWLFPLGWETISLQIRTLATYATLSPPQPSAVNGAKKLTTFYVCIIFGLMAWPKPIPN